MEQHPIPQQISSYQFRLVGDMTLKQFFQLAGGILVSILFYASNLPGIIKWPFIILSALLGVALAFVPLEERPLEKWIFAFFKAIYSPTIFAWKRATTQPAFYQPEGEAATAVPKIVAPGGEAALNQYLGTLPTQKPAVLTAFEQKETSFLSTVGQLFAPFNPIRPVTTAQPLIRPVKEGVVPMQAPTPVSGIRPKMVIEEVPRVNTTPQTQVSISGVPAPIMPAGRPAQGGSAQFSVEATPPSPPTVPNTVVGQILDEAGKIVPGAILEIRDAAGRPVRALKTNMLGHFMIVTPLSDGRFEIVTEKEGFQFPNVTFDAKGEIIPPILLRAKSVQTPLPINNVPPGQAMQTI